jgi:hypothetical protein
VSWSSGRKASSLSSGCRGGWPGAALRRPGLRMNSKAHFVVFDLLRL